MAVPKRKMSRANTRTRRATWKAKMTDLVTIRVQGREVRVPRRLVKAYKTGLIDIDA
ncbi:MAG: 50S ribosomal protein L32 [Actinomycetaceae bacterium]|nr:50S ribosomal protein L32 [Actinomycetaceae bacterium]